MTVARVILPGGMSALLLMGLLIAVPFPSGWEVANSIEALTLVDSPGYTFANDCQVWFHETVEVTIPRLSECSTGPNNWHIDVDSRYAGRPSLFMETSPVRHTNFQGIQTDNNMAVETRKVTRGGDTYFLDYHVFMFDFQVRTVADVRKIECEIEGGCRFEHETSASPPCITKDFQFKCSIGGIPFAGSSFVAFFINPWSGAREQAKDETGRDMVKLGQWIGVMQAIIFKAEGGYDTKIPAETPTSGEAILAENAAANMFSITTTEATEPLPSFQFGTATLDDSIPQLVLIELPYKLQPGADVETVFGGGIKNIVPNQVFVRYTVRVDTIHVTGWEPQVDFVDTNSNNIIDIGEFTFVDMNNNNAWDPGIDAVISGTPPSSGTESKDDPDPTPDSPPQTGSKLDELKLPPDFRLPAPCEFWNIVCWFNTAINFPTLTSVGSLLTVLAVIVLIVFGASIFLGRRRGR